MVLFGAAVVWSAFLLFLVQPLLAKMLLPWFGGTAGVWAACAVFFQVMLLAGYAYAHLLNRWLPLRRQAGVHGLLLAAAAWFVPLGAAPPSASGAPEWSIASILFSAAGVPYFVLSSTSPLLQSWYAQLQPAGKAYRLFAWSNVSCALALLGFPLFFERLLPVSETALWWSRGFSFLTLLLMAVCFLVARRAARTAHAAPEASAPAAPRHFTWIFFPALGAALLLAVTNHLCQVVAPAPFLWVLPLLLYLLTFAAVFERDTYRRIWGMPVGVAGLLAMAWATLYMPPDWILTAGIATYCLGLFAACFFLHGELAASRPPAAQLTVFYIDIAIGGAAGTAAVAYLAPALFRGYYELPVLLALCGLTALFMIYRKHWLADIAAAASAVLLVAAAASSVKASAAGALEMGRNFYGALRVVETRSGAMRAMIHGSVNHGSQFTQTVRRAWPTTYYGPDSGAGLVLQRTPPGRRVGIIGLGAGTLSVYGHAQDTFRYYEINPLVIDMARRRFTFLSDSPARHDIVLGDARLRLEQEPPNAFDLLVVDAFSGDSIPLHLLTREAFQVYTRHLKPGGLLALHISNQFLDLLPVTRALARSSGLDCRRVTSDADDERGLSASIWAVAGTPEALAAISLPAPGPTLLASAPLWTDDYSTLISVLR